MNSGLYHLLAGTYLSTQNYKLNGHMQGLKLGEDPIKANCSHIFHTNFLAKKIALTVNDFCYLENFLLGQVKIVLVTILGQGQTPHFT